MNLNRETILDIYTFERKKFLCLINVNPRSHKFKNSCRCLSQEQWITFDKKLEKLLTDGDNLDEKAIKFTLKPFIEVKVQKSKLSFNHFYKLLDAIGVFNKGDGTTDFGEQNLAFECLIDFQQELSFSSPIDSQETTLDDITRSPLGYDPHPPTIKKYKMHEDSTVSAPSIDFLGYDESLYIQKSILEEDNDTCFSEIMQNSALKTTNATTCLNGINSNKGLSETLINSTSRLSCSGDSNKSIQNDGNKKDDETISQKKDECIETELNPFLKTENSQIFCATKDIKFQLNDEKDNSKKPTEISKSEDVPLELNIENIRKTHKSKKKKHSRDKDNSHHDEKITKNRSKTIDEFPKLISAENNQQKKLIDDVNKQPYKRKDTPYKTCTQDNKEKKKVSSLKAKTRTEKQHEGLLNKDGPTSICTIQTKTSPKASSLEIDNLSESAIEESPQRSTRNRDAIAVRRSERSPSKPKRFIDEHIKKHKSHNKEVFCRDDDEDNLFEDKKEKFSKIEKKNKSTSPETPVSKKPPQRTSSSSSKKNKRKRDNSAECQQEKRDMSKWLSKKNSKPLEKKSKISSSSKPSESKPLPLKTSTNVKSRKIESDANPRSKSETLPPMAIELPSKEEIEVMRNKADLMRKENARVKAELDKLRTTPPKQVEILSLQNIPVDDILNTFSSYREELDEVYTSNSKKDHIRGNDGINHCLIIRLLQQSTQMKMLEKLTNVYGDSNKTTQATLFANALLPEWVIRVYMEKFDFTRQQAIDQITAQEAFQLHMEEQSENSFELNL